MSSPGPGPVEFALVVGAPAAGAQAARLPTAVQAPLPRVDTILAGNPGPNDLVAGGWIARAAREDAGGPWQRHRADGTWEAWHPEPATTDALTAAEEPALA